MILYIQKQLLAYFLFAYNYIQYCRGRVEHYNSFGKHNAGVELFDGAVHSGHVNILYMETAYIGQSLGAAYNFNGILPQLGAFKFISLGQLIRIDKMGEVFNRHGLFSYNAHIYQYAGFIIRYFYAGGAYCFSLGINKGIREAGLIAVLHG